MEPAGQAALSQISKPDAVSLHSRQNFGDGGLPLLLGMAFGISEKRARPP